MDNIVRLSQDEREELFNEAAAQKGVRPGIIEKDFWVCWILGKLYQDDFIKSKIMFKGGTSLSKVFGLIERFSEDIDLILDWWEITDDDPEEERSKRKQVDFNTEIRQASYTYLNDIFLPKVQELTAGVCEAEIDPDKPNEVIIKYPKTLPEEYLRPEILLETGPIAAWVPNSAYMISPYAAQEFPDQFKSAEVEVMAIKAERTFWEKATILHHEANRPVGNTQPKGYSRHYYDMMKMAVSDVKGTAFQDIDLLKQVVEFKKKFYYRAWAKYEEAIPGTLKLIPPGHVLDRIVQDYKEMEIMIFGEVPSLDEILRKLTELESEINAL
jgi:hypothetical protein